ncbi:MAG: PAS domain S-box protein [Planctomycetota bacterium]|nr:PAS domain S-box protein [Planctomycetota bacterium]
MSSTENGPPGRLSQWALAGWCLAVLALLAGGYWFYREQERSVRQRVEERLEAVARIKADQIAAWRKDQWVDAGLLADNPFMVEGVERLWDAPGAIDVADLRSFFRQTQQEHDYADILVVDERSQARFSLSGQASLTPEFSRGVETALRERKRVFVDLMKPEGASEPLCAVVAPLSVGEANRGALVLVIDASHRLFPLIQSAPMPGETLETFLVRRESDEVLVLNDLRFQPDAAFSLRFPLSQTDKPMVQAVQGRQGVVPGVDYRGVKVLSAIGPVPGTPWFVVCKMDSEEALAAWHFRTVLILTLFGALIAALAGCGFFFWQRQRRRHYQTLYQAEAQRREAAERHGVVLRSIGDAVVVTDGQGRVELLNGVAEALTGWSDREARGMPLAEVFRIVNERTRQMVESPVERVLREGKVVGLANHTLLIARDGTERPIADSGAPVRSGTGAVSGVVLVFRDQTEQYAFHKQLSASEERYRTFIEGAPDAIFVQAEDRFAYLNPACLRLLGADAAQDLLGRPILERFHPSFHEAIRERIRRLAAGQEAELAEEAVVTLAGETVSVEVSAVPFRAEGKPGAVVFMRDIRLRKHAEAERERLAKALDQLAEAVMITDVQGTIEYANPACERSTGYSREELIGRNPRILKSGKQDEEHYRELWETIRAGRTWKGRMVNRRKNGTFYTEETAISPVFDEAGAIRSYIAVKLDVTEQLELEERFLHAQRLSAVGQLAGGVAHDFNNLLTVINGYSRLALDRAAGDEALRKQLEHIGQAGDRAAALTRQLLAFSRKQVLRPEVLDLNGIVRRMDEMLRRLLGEDIDLVMNLRSGLYAVKVDPGQMEQVVMNLAVNARDAMPRGGKLTLETANVHLDESYTRSHAGALPGPHTMLAVTDTGSGMDAATRARIFEPFFTTKAPGKGTGLGLATVFGIVKQSGGDIWVYSELGKGTTFKVYLPRAEEAASSAGEPESEPEEAVTTGTGTILVVEDEEGVRELLRTILEEGGYRVLDTGDPEEAVRLCGQSDMTIDAILTDVVMPKLSGREVAERAVAARPGLKVIYMSGYTDNAIVHHGVLDPGTPFIEKPVSPNELLKKLRRYLS